MSDWHEAPPPEFSRSFALADVADGPVRRHLTASAEECARIARRLELERIDWLEATVEVMAGEEPYLFVVRGRFTADVTQTCVVSLNPVQNRLEREFATLYTTEAVAEDRVGDAEEIEYVEGDAIDLGEEIVQQLAVALDPYPRAPGAELDPEWRPDPADAAGESPFAALAALRKERKRG